MRALLIIALPFAAASTIGTRAAKADTDYWPTTQYGIELSAGGGVQDFTSSRMKSTTDAGGMWDVRAVVGTRSPIALEGAYTGTAQGINSIFGGTSATLVGTGLSSDLRLNLFPMETVTPFAFGGLGWKRYDIQGADFTTADTGINDSDNLLEIPLGGGLAVRQGGLTADARFTYDVATGSNLVIANDARDPVQTNDRGANMDNWSVSARIGTEF